MEVNSLTNEYNRDIEALRRRLQEREEDQVARRAARLSPVTP